LDSHELICILKQKGIGKHTNQATSLGNGVFHTPFYVTKITIKRLNINVMTEKDIRNAISILELDKEDLQNQIEQIDLILDRYESQLMRIESKKGKTKTMTRTKFPSSNESNLFPINESLPNQITFVMNSIGIVTRLPDIEKKYKELSGNDRIIRNVARRMKEEGELVAAKFNNANMLTFYGLPEWVETNEEGDKTYIINRRPSKEDLTSGYNTIKFI
jgi:hypothetical protein